MASACTSFGSTVHSTCNVVVEVMNWRFAVCPKSVASLRSRCSAASLVERKRPTCLHHGVLISPPFSGRGFCWVRRTPPFPRKAVTSPALLQDSPERKHLPFIDVPPLVEGSCDAKSPISSNLVENANGPSFTSSALGDEGNFAAIKATTSCANAVGNPFGTAVSAAAITFSNSSDALEVSVATDADFDASQLSRDSAPSATDISVIGASMAVHSSLENTSETCSASNTAQGSSSKSGKIRRMLNSCHAVMTGHKEKHLQWFPYLDQFKVKDRVLTSTQIMDMLGPFMFEERKERIKRVVANRTYTVCPVVEGLLDIGNIAAVLRSADALGFQSVHAISNETDKRYKKNRRISMGSEKWLDAELYQATGDCFEELRSRGYRIAVASLTDKAVPICDMDWTVPTAVVFGNEYRGVSMEALQLADFSCYIPMEGMVDSFNVSVAAGIVLHHAVNDRKARLGKHGDLGEEEQRILSADFYLRHSSRSLSLIDRLLQLKQEVKKTDLRSVLKGDLELDIELPEYLKLDLEKLCSEFNSS